MIIAEWKESPHARRRKAQMSLNSTSFSQLVNAARAGQRGLTETINSQGRVILSIQKTGRKPVR
jgi:hypothetical protein